MNYVFIIRAYNDLDMISPIIWKASKNKDSNVIIINTSPADISIEDPRIKFIKKNASIKYFEIPKLLNDFSKKFFSSLKVGWIHRMFFNKILTYSQKHFDEIQINKNLSTGVFMSYLGDNATNSAIKWADRNKFFKIFVDHGVNPFFLNKAKNKKNRISSFDAFIINNKVSEKKIGNFQKNAIKKIYACPRFSLEWSEKLNKIYSKNSKKNKNGKFKITFMLSKYSDKDNKKEVINAIEAASKLQNVKVQVKPHTRGMLIKNSLPYNVSILGTIHSRKIIQDSDLIIFTHSSIFLDAILLNKPVIHLTYATNVKLSSNSLDNCKVYNQYDFLNKVAIVKQKGRLYSKSDRKKCLDFFAGKDNGLMLDNIMSKINSKIKKR